MNYNEPWYWVNDYARDFLARGYLAKGQTVEERVAQIAQKAEEYLKIPGFAEKMIDYVSRGWISFSSPVWSNFANQKGLPISCFGSYVDDTMGSIMFTNGEVGMMAKLGGGCSGYFGALRARGTEISGNGQSSGAVHFMQLFETLTDVVSQGSVRRGHFSPYLPIEHPDIGEFLKIGTEGNPIQKLTHGVTVTSKWLQEMEDGDTDKRAIWAEVLQRRKEMGYPYVMFIDNANNNKSQVYKDNKLDIYASNMCVAPETLILTEKGYVEISLLKNQSTNIWNGKEWSEVEIKQTGTDQELMLVTSDSGHELWCTPYHKFHIVTDTGVDIVETKDLKEGDKLIRPSLLPVIEGQKELSDAYAQGFFSGDGTIAGKYKFIDLYAEKQELFPLFSAKAQWISRNEKVNRIRLRYDLDQNKDFVPFSDYNLTARLEWFAGLCDSDGAVNSGQIQLVSINKSFLHEVMLMLQTMGVNAKIKKLSDAGYREMPDNKGGSQEYYCQDVFRLLVSRAGVDQLVSIGFKPHRIKIKPKEINRTASRYVVVRSVEKTNRVDDTFCFTEPKEGLGMFNGLLTGQCSEIMLPSKSDWSFVCCLSSLNLLHYDDWKDTDLVETMTYFLDAVMEEFIIKLEELRDSENPEKNNAFMFLKRAWKFAKKNRALGLGVLGYHSYLQSKMIPFESEEANQWNKEVFSLIRNRAEFASRDLASKFGEPDILKGYGLRNTTLMAVAPTKSSSFILGQVSQGIEPVWSNCYIQDVAKMKVVIKNPFLVKLLQEKGYDNDSTWLSIRDHDGSVQHLDFLSEEEKAVFRTFAEINQFAILDQAAVRQAYIDQGQSLNLMIPPSMPTKEINALHLYAAKAGIKALYYQHSMSAAQEMVRQKLNK